MATRSLQAARPFLGRWVTVLIDRPLGSRHPEHGFRYPVNYGYVPGTVAPDGEALDAYVLGVQEPLSEFTGVCVAIIHRRDDDDDKLVLVPAGIDPSDDVVRGATRFQEQFFDSVVLR